MHKVTQLMHKRVTQKVLMPVFFAKGDKKIVPDLYPRFQKQKPAKILFAKWQCARASQAELPQIYTPFLGKNKVATEIPKICEIHEPIGGSQ